MKLFVIAAAAALLSNAASAATITASNTGSISIPASGTSGNASPYPATITVSGQSGVITDLNVTLNGLSHTFAADLDIVLIGPNGAAVALLLDRGGGSDFVNAGVTFDDEASGFVTNPVSGGAFKPSGSGGSYGGTLPAGTILSNALSVFDGLGLNGIWALYVFDDLGDDSGRIANGFTLTFTTAEVVPLPAAAALFPAGAALMGFAGKRRKRA